MLERNGKIIGTVALEAKPEVLYDSLAGGRWLTENINYMNLYRLAVCTSEKNKGIGAIIMKEVENLCSKEKISSIRVYTKFVNYIMQNFLIKCMYTNCGTITCK